MPNHLTINTVLLPTLDTIKASVAVLQVELHGVPAVRSRTPNSAFIGCYELLKLTAPVGFNVFLRKQKLKFVAGYLSLA